MAAKPFVTLCAMPSDSGQRDNDTALLEQCQQGDPEALAELRDRHHRALENILVARGASPAEAEEALAEIWARCVAGGEESPSLLEKFNGNCRLLSWLARVVTNRWLDHKRKDRFRGEPPITPDAGSRTEFFYRIPAELQGEPDAAIVALLRDSLRAAFARCAPDALVLLRLVYLHDVSQREVMRMLGWSESKVSRTLSRAMDEIRTEALRQLKAREPLLTLTWQDLQDLCETEQKGFL
jgi:RNA polymerase sigma factor (sigma-70 family)